MRIIWRFYVGADCRWHWQKVSADREVVQESAESFDEYEECVAGAKTAGYKFEAAQSSSRRTPSIRQPGWYAADRATSAR
jgi:hypothetical protein